MLLGIFMLLVVLLQLTAGTVPTLPIPWTELFVGLVMLWFPVILVIGIRKNYKLNTSLHQPISYTFGPMGIEVKGENFSSSHSWDQIHKVTETSLLVVVWQNPKVVNIIPNRFFEKDELETFRTRAAKNN